MIPIKQTVFTEKGNCFPACLASLLELSIDEIPNFCADLDNWPKNLYKWLIDKGLFAFKLSVDDFEKDCKDIINSGYYYLAVGVGKRGYKHCVIYQYGKMIHDPHPDNTGLKTIDNYELYFELIK